MMQGFTDDQPLPRRDWPLAELTRDPTLTILEGSPHGVLIIDRNTGEILWANGATKRAHGILKGESLSLSVAELLIGLEEARPEERASPIGQSGVIVQFRLRDGSSVPIEVFEQPLTLLDQRTVSLLHLRDATGQYGARKQEERIRRLLADSFSATMIIAANGIIRYVAPSIQHILGYSEQEFLRMNIRALHHPDERKRVGALVRATPHDGTPRRMQTRIRHADGSYRHIETTIRNFVKHPDVAGILANFRDVTERVEAERDARKRTEEVHVLARYMTMAELGSAIAHELNQPVAAIRNYAAGCLRALDNPEGLIQGRWALQQIAAEAERATRIMRSVHDFTMHKRIERKVLPISEILEDISAFLQLKVQESEALLTVDVKSGLKAWCDKTLIGQVILNLALNGLEAMQNQTDAKRALHVSARNIDEDLVEIMVSDKGAGMSSDQLEALFQARLTTKEHGFGLGLILSRSVVSNHGGSLRATSIVGAGTTFYVTLPRRAQKNQVFTFTR